MAWETHATDQNSSQIMQRITQSRETNLLSPERHRSCNAILEAGHHLIFVRMRTNDSNYDSPDGANRVQSISILYLHRGHTNKECVQRRRTTVVLKLNFSTSTRLLILITTEQTT